MTLNELKKGLQFKLLLISLAVMLLSLALPIAMLQIYDRILPNQGVGTAWVLALGVVTAMALEAGLRYGRSWLLNRAGMKFEAWSNVEVMRRLISASPAELREFGHNRIEDGMSALKRLQDYYSGQAMLALYDAPFIILFLAMIYYVGGMVVVIPLAVLAIAFLTVYLLGRAARRYAEGVEIATEKRGLILGESFENILSLKGLALEGALTGAFDQHHRTLASQRAGLDEYLMRIQLVTSFFSQGTTILVVMFSAHLVISGEMSSGALAACTLLAGRTMAPVGALFSFWGRYQSTENAQEKAEQLLSLGGDEPDASIGRADSLIGMKCSDIELPGIDKRLGINVMPGEILRLEEHGWLRWSPLFESLAGISDTPVALCQLRNSDLKLNQIRVALVSDQMLIFRGTVLENLTTYNASRESLAYDWSRRLGLHERIIQLPQGYHTPLREQFASGVDHGMEQLIGIVRALVSHPDLLILDHADRGLDMLAQKSFATVLEGLRGQVTCLVTSESDELGKQLPVCAVSEEANR